MNEREIEVMKLRVQIYKENLEKINNQIISINYSSGFGSVDENTIGRVEALKKEGSRFLKLSESILSDIDEYDTSVIGISVSEINDNKKKYVTNFISLENGLITRYNRDVIKMKKRIEQLKDKVLEYSDVVSKIDKIVLPEECSLDINNYNTRLSSKHLDYTSLKNIEHEIENIESMLNVKRDKEIDEIEGYIAYFDDRLNSNIPMDLISLKDLSDKVTKNGISNKITNDEKKINEVLFKLEKLKDKLSDSEYNTYYSIIADKAIGYRKLRQELMSIDVKSYSDELKKEYNLVKSELIEVPKKIEDLMVSQILPLTKGVELGEGPRNYYKKIIDSFSSSLLTIEKIIKKCRETGRFEEQLCHNLMVYYNLADKKLNEVKNLVGMSLKEESDYELKIVKISDRIKELELFIERKGTIESSELDAGILNEVYDIKKEIDKLRGLGNNSEEKKKNEKMLSDLVIRLDKIYLGMNKEKTNNKNDNVFKKIEVIDDRIKELELFIVRKGTIESSELDAGILNEIYDIKKEIDKLRGLGNNSEEKKKNEKMLSDLVIRLDKIYLEINKKKLNTENNSKKKEEKSRLRNDVNVGLDKEKILEVKDVKRVDKSFLNKFSKSGLMALGLSVMSLNTPLGSILIPALILGNVAYAFKEPILKQVNEILGRTIGAKKNERGEWVNSNGTVMNTSTSLLKTIAASGAEKISVVKKMVSGVKDVSRKIPMFEDKKVLSLYKEYCKSIDKISLEEFCNEKNLSGNIKDKFIKYVNNMEYNEVKGRSK